jgi:glycosyltransferase involved in cell wall biosynthesis
MGQVSAETKHALLRSCRALVLPSILEGFGRVIIEAFAMYKPVIVSKIKALSEVVDDGVEGFLVSPNDIGMWSNRIKYLLSNRDVCRTLGINGRNKVKDKFNQSVLSDRLEELYKNVVSGNAT